MARSHLRSCIAVLLVAAFCGMAVHGAPELQLAKMDQGFADEYGAKCLDGSPPYRYQLAQDPARWVLFVEGGGWCFSTSDCAGRAQSGGGSSRYADPTAFVGGLLSPDPAVNPRFANYSLVFLKYCDGTSHTSHQIQPIPTATSPHNQSSSAGQIWMRGRAVLQAQIMDLLLNNGMRGASEIIVSGGSAGALTVYVGLDYIADIVHAYNPAARVVGAPDAGFFLDAQSVVSGQYEYRQNFINADRFWNATTARTLNRGCLQAYPQEPWRCYLSPYAAPFILTPFFISNSAYDLYQTINILGLRCTPNAAAGGLPQCTAAQMAVFVQYRQQQLQGMQATLTSLPFTGVGLLSCFVHEINVDYCSGQSLPNCLGWNAYNVTAPGYPPQLTPDAIFTMWYDQTMLHWDSIVAARKAAHERLLERAREAGSDGASGVATMLASLARAQHGEARAQVQVIDPVDFPNNPSCPFPRK